MPNGDDPAFQPAADRRKDRSPVSRRLQKASEHVLRRSRPSWPVERYPSSCFDEKSHLTNEEMWSGQMPWRANFASRRCHLTLVSTRAMSAEAAKHISIPLARSPFVG